MVLGLDPLPHRIELAREKTRPNLSLDVGDANDLAMNVALWVGLKGIETDTPHAAEPALHRTRGRAYRHLR